MNGFALRVVLGLGDGAGGGEGGGIGGGEGGGVICRSGMDGPREMMRWYQVRGSVHYSGRFRC